MTDQLAPDELDDAGDDDSPGTDGDAGTLTPAGDDPDRPETRLREATGTGDTATTGTIVRHRRDRVSRWDRPPEPRDWRFWVGNLGRVLIATGLLMFGFVAYQLWGTGIETARAQATLEDQFERLLAADADGVERSGSGPEPTDLTADGGRSDTTVGAPDSDPDAGGGVLADIRDSTRVDGTDIPVAVDLADQAVVQDIPPIVRGDVLARLEIPRIDQVEYIVPGVSLEDLKRGSGHYPDTPLPGQLGNAAIAGHRTTYGAPFFDVDQLGAGDELIVTMANGERFVYLVTFVEVVSANDYWVVSRSDPNTAELTLTSCHPKYTARDRIVVHSVLDPAQSSTVGIPVFYELEPDDSEPIPGDDPVVAAPADDENADPADDAARATAADGIDVAEPASESERDPVPERSTATDDGAEPDGAATITTERPRFDATRSSADAFSQGWFEDRAAFAQILLWGAAVAIISLFAHRVARHYRRYWAGFVVGIGPFLFALYFFYQNVNRLLPPGI